MRRWGMIWIGAALVAWGVIAIQPGMRTEAQGDGQVATIAALQTAVAKMQTQVAILQTRVPGASAAASAPMTATVAFGTGKLDAPAAVGQTVNANGLAMTLIGVKEVANFPVLSPAPGDVFLVLDFKLVDVVHDTKSYSDNWFSGSDIDQGWAFNHPADNPTSQPLGHGTLSGDGAIIRGTAVLEIKTSSHRIRIKYDTDGGTLGTHESVYWLYTR